MNYLAIFECERVYISVMVCVNVLNKVAPVIVKFNPARCSAPEFQKVSRLSGMGDVFISSGNKATEQASNPLLDAVQKALLREEKPKIADNMHDMIVNMSKSSSDAIGKDAIVFSVPEHKELVLRVEKSALDKMDKLPSDLELVPISYQRGIAENPHLGLPLYMVTPKSSALTRKPCISPLEALTHKDNIMILRRVTGEHPAERCGKKFQEMIGFADFHNPDPDALNNFSYVFGYVKENFGPRAAMDCMEMIKSGVTEIPAHAFGEGSASFTVVKGKDFYQKYKAFADSYVDALKEISEFPQKSYDEAVNFVIQPKNFNVDFQHTNNTFVDLEKQEFNFMDFAYDKKDPKYIYENPVKEFRNVLMGKCFKTISVLKESVPFLPEFQYPRDFIVSTDEIRAVKKFSSIINEKVNAAAPEEFKSEKFFK